MSTQPATPHREWDSHRAFVALGLTGLLLAPALVRANINLMATLPDLPAPLVNAISRAEPSTLTVLVTNTGTQIVRQVAITIPSQYNSVTSASAPDSVTWTTTTSGGTATFRSTTCSSAGIPPGDSAAFVISFHGNYTTNNGDNPASSAFTVNGTTSSGGTACDPSVATNSTTFTAPVKSLYIQGALTWTGSNTATITWTVTNNNGSEDVSNVAIDAVVTTSTGSSTLACPTIPSIVHQGTPGTSACQYTFPSTGTYTFRATARNDLGAGDSSAAGATVGPINYGDTPSINWTKSLVVAGPSVSLNTLNLIVSAPSSASVTSVELLNDNTDEPCKPGNWTLSDGTAPNPPGGTATNGLAYGTSTSERVVFSGTLSAGLSSSIAVNWSAVPNPTARTDCPLRVNVTYGPSTAATQTIRVAVPIDDVDGFAIRNDAGGKLLWWKNTERPDAPHDGVVIFREPVGTDPAKPVQLKQYTVGQDRVVFLSSGGDQTEQWTDPTGGTTAGNFNYRVCNHDANLVYSSCSEGLKNNLGYLTSEVAPTGGGWVVALGGDASTRVGLLPGNTLVGQASNAPSMTVLNVATGLPAFPAVTIPGLPSVNSPAITLRDGSTVLFAGDQDGHITAIDIHTGASKWAANPNLTAGVFFRSGEKFTGGVMPVNLSGAHPQFQTDYQTDVVFVGSSTTGKVYAVDAVTGDELWNITAGSATQTIGGVVVYDYSTNYLIVPTQNQGGVKAYNLSGTGRGNAPKTNVWTGASAALKAGTNMSFLNCIQTAWAEAIACITTGIGGGNTLYVVDKTSGGLLASVGTSLTGSPSLARVSTGDPAKRGFVVTSGRAARVYAWTSPNSSISLVGSQWRSPTGTTISPAAVYGDKGYFVVGCTNKTLYRLSLANPTVAPAQSQAITSELSAPVLARPAYDSINLRYVFGTNDGHLWSIPFP